MSTKARASLLASRQARSAGCDRWCRSTDSSCMVCPKVNSRSWVPIVDGAYTPPNRVFMPPLRTMSTSSTLSAPAHIAAIKVANFGAGLAEPDLIFGALMQTLSASSSPRPVWAASVITGTRPVHDTRCSSSNTAEAWANVCDTCTESAFLSCMNWLCENSNHPSSEGTFIVSTPRQSPVSSVD